MPPHREMLFFALLLVTATFLADARSTPQEEQAGSEFRQSLKGRFLVSARHMKGSVFERSVVLMIEHDAQGAFGLIVNKPIGAVPRHKVFGEPGVEGVDGAGDLTIFYGGPVSPNAGFAVHDGSLQGETTRHVAEGVAVSDQKLIAEAVVRGEGPARYIFVVGYAGWAPGQLESELRRDDWVTAPLDRSIVYDRHHDTKWQRAIDSRFRNL